MGFQTTVSRFSGAGVPGELASDSPTRAQSYILNSTSSSLNIIGSTVFTVASEGVAQAGGTTAFAGFLIDPKQYALFATGGQTLTPTLTLPNGTQADLLTMGDIWVTLPAAASIGDVVIYNTVSGAISTITPGASLGVNQAYANAFVSYYTVSGAGLAVITVNPTYINVVPFP